LEEIAQGEAISIAVAQVVLDGQLEPKGLGGGTVVGVKSFELIVDVLGKIEFTH